MITLTSEQLEIIYAEDPLIFVDAKAGTGKTTTLKEFSKIRKQDSFVYIVYNNSMKKEVVNKFPERVKIYTIHSLAYECIGFKYKDKLENNLTIEQILNNHPYFQEKDINNEEYYKLANAIMINLNMFFNSKLKDIKEIFLLSEVEVLVEEYWSLMKDVENLDVNMTQDGYLKLYHLSNPFINADYIMVDEAQDSNEVMLDIVFSQKAKKIFVGDPDQKIYGFRGAINIFETNYKSGAKVLQLTESFRFGNEIAIIANNLLEEYKENHNVKLKGTDGRESSVNKIDYDLPYTYITRTNSEIFDKSIELIDENKKIHIIGGIDIILNNILDLLNLKNNKKHLIKNEKLKKYTNYTKFKSFTKHVKIPEYIFIVKIIEKYGDYFIYEYIEKIKKSLVSKKEADVTLVTAHKSKGLEFLSVKLADDFYPIYNEFGLKRIDVPAEEINLLYVSLTRSTFELELNEDLNNLLNLN